MFEVKLISSLLGNGESWIGLTKEHICIMYICHLAKRNTISMVEMDSGIIHFEQKKLQLMGKIMSTDMENICVLNGADQKKCGLYK